MLTANKLGIAIIHINGKKTNYMIDYTGEVYNYKLQRPLKVYTRIMPKGDAKNGGEYKQVRLSINNKEYKRNRARLMAEHFIPHPKMHLRDEKGNYIYEIDHINGVCDDDRLENLQWLTKAQNLAKREFDAPF